MSLSRVPGFGNCGGQSYVRDNLRRIAIAMCIWCVYILHFCFDGCQRMWSWRQEWYAAPRTFHELQEKVMRKERQLVRISSSKILLTQERKDHVEMSMYCMHTFDKGKYYWRVWLFYSSMRSFLAWCAYCRLYEEMHYASPPPIPPAIFSFVKCMHAVLFAHFQVIFVALLCE